MSRNVDEWDFEVIIRDARRHPEVDEEVYAKLLMIQTHPDCIGHIFRTEEFADWVKGWSITSYDGHGYFVNINGEDGPMVCFNVKKILERAKEYPFVRWCNK